MIPQEGTSAGGLYWKSIGEGPTVVVLHGGPGADHGYLLPQFEALAQDFKLFFYDQRGGGRSRIGSPAPTWQDHVADLEALRQEFNLGALRLCGYSWGGLLALLYALGNPDRVERMALVAPAPPVHSYRAELAETLAQRTASAEAIGLQGFARAVAGYFADALRANELTPFRIQTRAADAVVQSLGNYDVRPQLSSLDLPVLILHGTHDPIPLRYSKELQALLPHARLVILEGTGHVPYIEAPVLFFEELRTFFRPSRGEKR